MPAFLLTNSLVAILAVLTTAVASVLKKWIGETSRTRRLIKSIEGARPSQRSEIIRAFSQLENRTQPQPTRPVGDTDASTPNRSSPLDDHSTKRRKR
jgi:hypothetical protein